MKIVCKKKQIYKSYSHRLTIPYAFALAMVIYIEEYLPTGPLAPIASYGQESCRRYSWTNLLYINDFVHTGECMGVTWYLACDMQMYWFSPFGNTCLETDKLHLELLTYCFIAILPLWYSEKIGLLLLGLYLVAFTVIPGYVTGHFHFGPTILIR